MLLGQCSARHSLPEPRQNAPIETPLPIAPCPSPAFLRCPRSARQSSLPKVSWAAAHCSPGINTCYIGCLRLSAAQRSALHLVALAQLLLHCTIHSHSRGTRGSPGVCAVWEQKFNIIQTQPFQSRTQHCVSG